jgi:hypothetical protein
LTEETICDFLIVGGGGAGDRQVGGGGDGGAVLNAMNVIIDAGTYAIKVGNGGSALTSEAGSPSEAFGAICLGGVSTTYVARDQPNIGNAGGSGSGGSAGNKLSLPAQLQGGRVGVFTKGTIFAFWVFIER